MHKGSADPEIRNHFGLTCYEGLGLKTPLQESGNYWRLDSDGEATAGGRS